MAKSKEKGSTNNVEPKDKLKEEVKTKIVYECPYAPMGKSSTAIECYYMENGQNIKYEYKLELMNKKYIIPDNITEKARERLIFCLKKNNFEDVTTISQKGIKYVKDSNAYMYYAVHPAHTEKHPINGNMALISKDNSGKDRYDEKGIQITKQIVIKSGVVKTDDKGIYNLLLKAGFLPGGKEVIDEG